MKFTTTLALLLMINLSINAQTPNWLWARGTGGGYINAQSIATDASGNVYITGSINDTMMIFGKDTLINQATNGAQNLFVVKYDSSGNVQWARSAGGGSNEGTESIESSGIGVDAGGNVYVIGSNETPIVIFGGDTLNDTSSIESFLVKYTPQGNVAWARTVGGTLNGTDGIVVDAGGNSYIVGEFTSGSIIGGTDTVPLAGYIEAFMIKYDSSGNSVLAAGIHGDNVINYAVAIDAATNIYVTGYFSGDSAIAGNNTLTNTGITAVYTVKYDPTGFLAWARNASVNSSIFATGISTDGNSNVYITGSTTGDTLAFGNDTAFTDIPPGQSNFFTAKYDSSGNIKWVNCSQGYPYAHAGGISADAAGNTYVTGYFQNTTLIIGKDTLIANDTLDQTEAYFVAKYDASGNALWAIGGTTGKGAYDDGAGIVADNAGNFYISGGYSGPGINFGNDTLPYTGAGGVYTYTFVAKYGSLATGIANEPVAPNTIAIYPNPSRGQFYFKGISSGSALEVFDVLGQKIFSTTMSPSRGGKGEDTYLLNISTQAKGVYFYRVTNNGATMQAGKMVVE